MADDETRPRAWVYDPEPERHTALAQVAVALTDGEGVEITHAAVDRGFPREQLPVPVAEVLDWLVEEDIFLYLTEPFFAEHSKDFHGPYDPWGSAYSATALAALNRELAVDAVRSVLARNFEPAPYDPTPDLAKIIYHLRRMPGPFDPAVAEALSALKAAGAWGTPYVIEARLRSMQGRGR